MSKTGYKTSEEAKTLDEASVQVKLYTIGLRKMGRPVTSGSIAYLEEANVKPVDVQETSLNEAQIRAENSVDGIIKRKFNPKAGENCKKCDHCEICRWRSK